MNKEFKTKISPCEITENDLALINRFTVKELKADEVYSFNVILCDNDVDRDGERFSNEALSQLAKLFVGVTGIFDHDPKSSNQSARIYSAECVNIPGKKTVTGEDYLCVKAKAYMPLTEKNADLIGDINAGIKKEVSVSCAVADFTCSICNSDMRFSPCNHVKGESYDGELCYCTLSNITDAYEWSFVAVPAQVNAGVTKSYTKEIETMENCIKAIKDGHAVKLGENEARQLADYINTLEKQAADGRCMRMREAWPPQAINVSALMAQQPRQVSRLSAPDGCRAVELSRQVVLDAVKEGGRFGVNLVEFLLGKVVFLNRRITALSGHTAGSRLELYLEENAVVKDGQRQVQLPCSLSEFAGLLCVGRASLYRTLDAMEAEGRIRRQGRTIYLAEEL